MLIILTSVSTIVSIIMSCMVFFSVVILVSINTLALR